MITVGEIKGLKSLRALNVFHTLMLGLKMLPMYAHESYEEFFSRIDQMPPKDQEKMIREAALFVELSIDDLEAIICFCKDPNGVPYGTANINNLSMDELFEIVVAVSVAISKIKINFVTESEKKN